MEDGRTSASGLPLGNLSSFVGDIRELRRGYLDVLQSDHRPGPEIVLCCFCLLEQQKGPLCHERRETS